MKRMGKLFRIFLIAGILMVAAYLLYPDFTRHFELRKELQEKAEEIERWEKANTELKREIKALHSDAHAVEKVAREKLGLVKPDEIIYRFQDANSSEQKPAGEKPR